MLRATMITKSDSPEKVLALFFTAGVSLKTWFKIGMIEREVALYNELSKYFQKIFFFTYDSKEDLSMKKYLADNITVVPKKYFTSNRALINLFYSLLLPLIHRRILSQVDVIKTNQMWGSWSAILTKLLYRKKIIVRTGFILSLTYPKKFKRSRRVWLIRIIEKLAYKLADGIITTSKENYQYIEKTYEPSGVHILIPNYVETDVFKPMKVSKRKGSICFVGRLTPQKNLFALLDAFRALPFTLTIIGSGEQKEQLKQYADENKIKVAFLGNVPNHKLPNILNQHELFILPSLWEGMPKVLLEAMSCGLPVIGTKVKGITEVITHGKNGILCDTDSKSIRNAIIRLMHDEKKRQLGRNARKSILERYSLDIIKHDELKLIKNLTHK